MRELGKKLWRLIIRKVLVLGDFELETCYCTDASDL